MVEDLRIPVAGHCLKNASSELLPALSGLTQVQLAGKGYFAELVLCLRHKEQLLNTNCKSNLVAVLSL